MIYSVPTINIYSGYRQRSFNPVGNKLKQCQCRNTEKHFPLTSFLQLKHYDILHSNTQYTGLQIDRPC